MQASKMIAYVLFALYFLWHFVQNYVSSSSCALATAAVVMLL